MSEEFAVLGFIDNFRSFSNGDIAVRVRIEAEGDKRRFLMNMAAQGIGVALFKLEKDAAKAAGYKTQGEGDDYGRLNAFLFKAGFFHSEFVAKALGSDQAFLTWVRKQGCFICGQPAEPAHVRSVAHGAGTGRKPEYMAVPMCIKHHRFVQHDEGICVLLEEPDKYKAREILVRKAVSYREKWAAETLCAVLGYDSWTEVPPAVVLDWVERTPSIPKAMLPASYVGYALDTR